MDTYSFIFNLWWIDRKVGGDLVGGKGNDFVRCLMHMGWRVEGGVFGSVTIC